MANDVFANGREIACKKGSGKSICAFPDVVWTPPDKVPPTPTGVPVPYPNTALASDTSKGTKKVKISGKEVMLKNSSKFKKTTGDEAGVAQLKGFLTMKNRGKVYFAMWSMDVKFEGKNVVRHFDIATHNHGSMPGNTAPWMYLDSVAISNGLEDKCNDVRRKINEDCTDNAEFVAQHPPNGNCSSKCCEAKKCALAPYKTPASSMQCCDDKTKHHIVPDHCFKSRGTGDYFEGIEGLSYNRGLAICVSGTDKSDTDSKGDLLEHGKIHDDFDRIEDQYRDTNDQQWRFFEASSVGADVCAFHTGCDKDCLKQQTDSFYRDKGVHPKTNLRANSNARQTDPLVDRENMGNTQVRWSSG